MKRLLGILLLAPLLALAQIGNYPALIGQRGTTTPTNCAIGQLFFDTDATAGQNIFGCTSANTWTAQANPAGGTIGGTISGGTAGSVLFVGTGPVLAQDNSNFKYSATLVSSGPGLQVGSGSTTSAGIVAGYYGSSGYGGLWATAVGNPSTANYFLAVGANDISLNAPGTGLLIFRSTDVEKMRLTATAGAGPLITAGTAVAASVYATRITRTNNNALVDKGVSIEYTDTTSAAGFLPFQVLGGASATTSLMQLTKDGYLSAQRFYLGPSGAYLFTGADGTGNTLAFLGVVSSAGVFALNSTGNIYFSNSATDPNTGDINLSRISAGLIGVGTGAAGSFAGRIKLTSTINAGTTIANLNASPTAGEISTITDQLTTCPAKGVAPTAGGSAVCPVFYNGAAWVGI